MCQCSTSNRCPVFGSTSWPDEALEETRTKRTERNELVRSFATLLSDLATLATNRIEPEVDKLAAFTVITNVTSIQRRAFELLGVSHRLGQLQ